MTLQEMLDHSQRIRQQYRKGEIQHDLYTMALQQLERMWKVKKMNYLNDYKLPQYVVEDFKEATK